MAKVAEFGRLVLDYRWLDLKPLYSGALVYSGGRLHRVGDPFHHPGHFFSTGVF